MDFPKLPKSVRIAAVGILTTPDISTGLFLRASLVNGSGDHVSTFETASSNSTGGTQVRYSMSVNSTLQITPSSTENIPGFLPPDFCVEPQDTLTFSFVGVGSNVTIDSPLVVSYEECDED